MHQISFRFFQRGITPEREITRTRKKKHVSNIFPWGIHIWNFKTLACTVHKIWHASDFIQIFSKGHNSRKGDNSDKKKKHVSNIFPWGIHIWNFKTLACTVLEQTDAQPETNMPRQLLRSWGHNYANTVKCSSLPWRFYIIFKTWIYFPTGFFFVLIYYKLLTSTCVHNYYLTRKNIISIKISTLTRKFSNPAVINHVKV